MKYYCNPLNIRYPYQFFDKGDYIQASRESADPSMVFFKNRYYLFPSMAAGFYTSEDLSEFTFHAFKNKMPVYGYAPGIRIIRGELYFCAMEPNGMLGIYKTKDPLEQEFVKLNEVKGGGDPCLFEDDDGRIYLYWGCSRLHPIYGVELSAEDMTPVGTRKILIYSNTKELGYERNGENHIETYTRREMEEFMEQKLLADPTIENTQIPYEYMKLCNATNIEGPYMTKYKGTYYLQYAATGTEHNVYCDAVYVSKKPLGPFTVPGNNPFAYKPEGFITGSGHGSTFKGEEERYFHISCLRISRQHLFERRLGLWPVGFDEDNETYCDQRYGDWPVRTDAKPFEKPDWMLLSYKKKVSVSSGEMAECICDEDIRTWWRADGNKNEWAAVDLGSVCDVRVVQINFADDKIILIREMFDGNTISSNRGRVIDMEPRKIRWHLEWSVDGEAYFSLKDKSEAETDLSHDLVVTDNGIKARYIRLWIYEVPFGQRPCISGLRVFGRMEKKLPQQPEYIRGRMIGNLDAYIFWNKVYDAVGYNLLWGYEEDKLYHSCMVYDRNEKLIAALVKGQKLFVRVDAFNEAGITEGRVTEIR